MLEVLKLLEKNGRLTAAEIAAMLGRDEAEIRAIIADCEARGAIMRYSALINYDKTEADGVTAMIEVRISPQHGAGFDRIAARISQHDEVESLYLMTGSYDLMVTMTARSMKDVAEFVYAHLATIEGVTGTATHFIMKKYKEKNCVLDTPPEQEERLIFA